MKKWSAEKHSFEGEDKVFPPFKKHNRVAKSHSFYFVPFIIGDKCLYMINVIKEITVYFIKLKGVLKISKASKILSTEGRSA